MATRWRASLLIQISGNKLTDNMVPDAIFSSPTREGAITGIMPYILTMTDDQTEKCKVIIEKVEV